ncbi:unnamed protein product [Rhizoctonia solani]|uniref:Uncharacterized protein n=1 Tax=Rhizoctonia solani TaxID=456999 RepID=A0A8H3DYG3_9AGAM|nr:unnamed protein product [Rhizoctonia solani]
MQTPATRTLASVPAFASISTIKAAKNPQPSLSLSRVHRLRMSDFNHIKTYSNLDKKANGILRWMGADNTKNDITRQPLRRKQNESSYQYFTRWLQSYGATLNWKMDFFPQAPKDQCFLWRPIVNGLDLSACSVGLGASTCDEYRAKEDACEAIVQAQRCFKRV